MTEDEAVDRIQERIDEFELVVKEAHAVLHDLRLAMSDAQKAEKRIERAHRDAASKVVAEELRAELNNAAGQIQNATQKALDRAVERSMAAFDKIQKSLLVGVDSRTGRPYDLRTEADRRLREAGFAPPKKGS